MEYANILRACIEIKYTYIVNKFVLKKFLLINWDYWDVNIQN